jgi:hypothetical protein
MLKIKQKIAKLKHGKIMDLLDAMNEIQYRHKQKRIGMYNVQ